MESLAVFVFCLVISGSSLVFALNCAGIDQRDRMPCMLSNPNISTCMGMGCCWSGGSADPRMKCFTKKGGKCIKYESASCKVMLNTTLVPYRETPRFIENQLGVMVTERFLQLVQDVIQKYVNDDKECQQILAPMLCHYTLPPCKPDGTIRPFCQEDCVAIFKRCKKPLDEVIGAVKYISSSQNMNFIHTVFPNCSKYKPSSKYDMSSNDSCVQTGYFIKVPPGRPNITITESEIQAVSVIIRWTKPVSDGGSVVTGYKVWINTTQPPREKLTKQTHANLAGLKKNTRYTVKVYAGNVAGYGDPAVASFTTKKQSAPPFTGEHKIVLDVAVFGILIAIIVASLLLNVFMMFYICKNKSKVGSKSTEKESERRKAQLRLQPPEPVYDNPCELEECAPPSTAASRSEVQGPNHRDIPDKQM